ncbi:DUF2977 domain-containing protein [Staphylococcus saprophyticus]
MQILLNGDNEITSYATIGGFENGIEIEKYPTHSPKCLNLECLNTLMVQ